MAKSRTKKSKQQKRQAASARKNQRRAEQAAKQQAQVPEMPIPEGPLSPGDRLNLILGAIGYRLNGSPFAARAVASVIDFILCGILAIIPLVTAFNMVGGATMTSIADLATAGFSMGAIAGVLGASLLLSYAYYVLIPLKLLPGKTPGKYLINLEIVMVDGTPATLAALSKRWAFLTLCETLCTFGSALLIQYVTLLAGDVVGNAYTVAGAAVTAVSAWMVWHNKPQRRALHDLLAGTWVYTGSEKG